VRRFVAGGLFQLLGFDARIVDELLRECFRVVLVTIDYAPSLHQASVSGIGPWTSGLL
jgi:hypothetical protein